MYCLEYQAIADRNFAACSRYYYAISKLATLAGLGKKPLFVSAKLECQQCLQECTETAAELSQHRNEHGC